MGYDPTKPYIKKIREIIEPTWDTPHVRVVDMGGTYPLINRLVDEFEFDHTDGLGTKGVHHYRFKSWDRAVIDALAMNLNDIATTGGVPYKCQVHLTMQHDNHNAIVAIMEHLANECKVRQIAITGGETSIQWNVSGMDISITMSSFLKEIRVAKFRDGDWLIGLRSSGLHANGLTRAAEVIPDNWLEVLTYPTVIYYDTVMDLISRYDISGMVHLAGGAWTRIRKLLSRDQSAYIDVGKPIPTVFDVIWRSNISDEDMYRTFNCGIGFVLGVRPEEGMKIVEEDNQCKHIGRVVGDNVGGVFITSTFSGQQVTL